MDRAVAADNDRGAPVFAAGQGMKHLRLRLLRAPGEQSLMSDTARLQQALHRLPCPLSRTAAGSGIYDQ
ncbi:hypothetical protein D3C79_979680 [compost metagenome]